MERIARLIAYLRGCICVRRDRGWWPDSYRRNSLHYCDCPLYHDERQVAE